MSLTGVLEQSAAERIGFAALLDQKLKRLLMEDDIEIEASFIINGYVADRRNKDSDSAPPYLSSIQGRNLLTNCLFKIILHRSIIINYIKRRRNRRKFEHY